MMHDLDDLVTAADIAAVLGVVPSAVTNWQRRKIGFPEPLVAVSLGHTKLWSARAVSEWYRGRDLPPPPEQTERFTRLAAVMRGEA